MTDITTYPYVAVDRDNTAIWGTGATEAEALADAASWIDLNGDPEDTRTVADVVRIVRGTPALVAEVERSGGALAFHLERSSAGDVACLPEEYVSVGGALMVVPRAG